MGYEVLVFLVSALVGFAAYVAGGWGPVQVETIRSLLTPRRVWILLAVTSGAVAVVACVIAVVALPGEWLYTVKGLFRLFAPHAILGLVFGLGFSIWLDQLLRLAALAGAQVNTAHRLWGIALVILFLGGIFMGPVNRLLPRLTGISTSVASLTFASAGHHSDLTKVIDTASGGGGTSNEGAAGLSRSYLEYLSTYFMRDAEYVQLLHGDNFEDAETLHADAKEFVEPIVNCFATAMSHGKSWDDAGVIHSDFGPALSAGAAWLRSVFEPGEEEDEEKLRARLAMMYDHLPPCNGRPELSEVPSIPKEAFELPYFPLAVAHMMQLAGYGRVGADLLAEWIDSSLQPDLVKKIPDWYRIRAYIHLSILVDAQNDSVSSHAVLGQSVLLFEKTLYASPAVELRDSVKWRKNCASSKSIDIRRLRFAFMTQTNQWIRHALYSGQVNASLLRYAQENAAIPVACYAGRPEHRDWRRAEFLVTSGGLLAALGSLRGGDDLESYRDARAYSTQALALLRPLEQAEGTTRRDGGALAAIQGHPLRDEVLEAQRYLSQAEHAIGIR